MKLQEQLNRTKELMGLQPLNEGVFKKVGKFSDIFKSKKYKNKTGEVVAQFIPPSEIPEDKYLRRKIRKRKFRFFCRWTKFHDRFK
jgi:hypothetical protein